MTPEDVIRNAANPFLALGLPVTLISQIELKKKYKQLALLFHPDKNPHPKAEEAFKVIVGAYEQLRDPGAQPALVARFWTASPPAAPSNQTGSSQAKPFSLFYFVMTSDFMKRPRAQSMPPTDVLSCPNCSFTTLIKNHLDFHTSIHTRKPAAYSPGFRFGPYSRIVKESENAWTQK